MQIHVPHQPELTEKVLLKRLSKSIGEQLRTN